jgi:hypothetical protein
MEICETIVKTFILNIFYLDFYMFKNISNLLVFKFFSSNTKSSFLTKAYLDRKHVSALEYTLNSLKTFNLKILNSILNNFCSLYYTKPSL